MKILTITSSFPHYKDSYEGGHFIQELVQNLSSADIIPVVLAPHFPGGKRDECWGTIQIHRFRYFLPERFERLAYGHGFVYNIRNDCLAFAEIVPFCIAEFFSSLILARRQKTDLVHSHWLLPQGLAGAILHMIFRIPHVATIHGSDLNLIKKYRLLRPVCRFIIRHSDSITVNSRYMRQQLLSVVPSCESRITVIPMGVDFLTFYERKGPDRRHEFETRHLILCISRLIDWKGTVFLIEALPEVLRQYPDARLVIIGVGPEHDNLLQKTAELNLGHAVCFQGGVSSDDLPSYYHSADVFVLPSINKAGKTEGLGVVLLEAMAAGCPVIGSNVGGIPDIITDGKNGFLVPEQRPDILAGNIIRIMSDATIREKFRENGYIRVRDTFSWETVSRQFLETYSRVQGKYE